MEKTHQIFVDTLGTGDDRDPKPEKEAKVLWKAAGADWKQVLMWLTDPHVGMQRRRAYLCNDCSTSDVLSEAKQTHQDVQLRRHVPVSNWVPTTMFTCAKCKGSKCEQSIDQVRRSDEEARLLVRCTLCTDLPAWQPRGSGAQPALGLI